MRYVTLKEVSTAYLKSLLLAAKENKKKLLDKLDKVDAEWYRLSEAVIEQERIIRSLAQKTRRAKSKNN